MPTPDFVLRLRSKIGHEPLHLPGVTAVILRDVPMGAAVWEVPSVLLTRRADTGTWAPVAGISEPGEDIGETAVREVCAGDPSLQGVARYLWDAGISTKTLAARLSTLAITPGDALSELLDGTTQKALRRHAGLQHEWFEPDPITARMEAAAQRHFPAWLINAHAARVLAGELDTGSLAWMTGIPPEQMDIGDAPPERELSGAELADLFG